ncbi:MAG: DoxX family membrane protein [Natronomonas sp.]
MSTKTTDTGQTEFGGITLQETTHPLAVPFVALLRLLLGGMILFAGLGKFEAIAGEAFDASGYLANVDPASPVSGLYAAMAASPVLVEAINVLIPVTQVLIGVALIAGAFVRLAALGGALQMFAFYLGGWEGQLLALFDSTLIYGALFLALGAFAAGRIYGLDAYIENVEVGGKRLVDRVPQLRYILG